MSEPDAQSVLVVEDEQSIASFVSLYLKNAGYGVRAVGTGSGALNAVAAEMPSLIVLDLNLPDMDGIEICRRIRKSSDVPILMLTARDEDVDKIIGLEVGADDYLTKPFNPRELVARVKSVLRRATSDRRIDEGDEIRHGDLLINSGRREVLVGDDEIQLAPKEFDLLWELLDHRGIVLTRDQLLERVWGYTFAGDTRTVDVHVRQIRRKLGDASPIVTVWGVGYKVATRHRAARLPCAMRMRSRGVARLVAAPPTRGIGSARRRTLPGDARFAAFSAAGAVPPRDRGRRRPGLGDRAAAVPGLLADSSYEELGREASGIAQLYGNAALRAAEEGSPAPDFAPQALELATGDQLFYVGAPAFPGQDSGLQRLPESAVPRAVSQEGVGSSSSSARRERPELPRGLAAGPARARTARRSARSSSRSRRRRPRPVGAARRPAGDGNRDRGADGVAPRLWLSRRISRPIQALAEASDEIAPGTTRCTSPSDGAGARSPTCRSDSTRWRRGSRRRRSGSGSSSCPSRTSCGPRSPRSRGTSMRSATG